MIQVKAAPMRRGLRAKPEHRVRPIVDLAATARRAEGAACRLRPLYDGPQSAGIRE
jgi:hypothetical protein